MTESIAEFLSSITGGNPYLTLFIISIIPVVELRGAIVLMGGMPDINVVAGMFCCVAGSAVIIVPMILVIRPLIRKLKKSKTFAKFGKKMEANLADRAESVHSESDAPKGKLSVDTKKFWGLFVFVAVPLPMTGAWTGSAIGGILDFKVWKAALAVFLGNLVAAGILTLLVVFIPKGYMDFFLYGFIILAVVIFVSLYFARLKRNERRYERETARYGNRSLYELAQMEKEANEEGVELIKKEYVDEEGNRHIIIGKDEQANKNAVKDEDKI